MVKLDDPVASGAPPAVSQTLFARVLYSSPADGNVIPTAFVEGVLVTLFSGPPPDPRHNLAPSWHVERDVTDYSALFHTAQSGDVVLGNLVNSTFTGVISGSAALEFYPKRGEGDRDDPALPADAVYPLTQSNGHGGFN